MGSHVEFNQEVLGHFVQCHQFEQLLLVQALRQFLWSFRYFKTTLCYGLVCKCYDSVQPGMFCCGLYELLNIYPVSRFIYMNRDTGFRVFNTELHPVKILLWICLKARSGAIATCAETPFSWTE